MEYIIKDELAYPAFCTISVTVHDIPLTWGYYQGRFDDRYFVFSQGKILITFVEIAKAGSLYMVVIGNTDHQYIFRICECVLEAEHLVRDLRSVFGVDNH